MTVSISNMAQVWMSNTNTYNGIAMSISTLGFGGNGASRVLSFRVDGNTKFDIDSNGNIKTCNSVNTFVMTSNIAVANTITANSVNTFVMTSNIAVANTITANSINTNSMTVSVSTANVIFANVYATFLATSNSSYANLPNANTVGAGSRAYVYDATATTFASAVIGGGANRVPVYSNGRNWLIG